MQGQSAVALDRFFGKDRPMRGLKHFIQQFVSQLSQKYKQFDFPT
jgi:hypothetical protein